jgi:hypothetical protein
VTEKEKKELEETFLRIVEELKEDEKNSNDKKENKPVNYWGTEDNDDNDDKDDKENEKPEEEEKKRDYELGPNEWIKSDREYEYVELLDRVYTFLTKKNPKLVTSSK